MLHELASQNPFFHHWNGLCWVHFMQSLCSTLTHQVRHELLGILQGIVKAEAFGERAAVLWNVLLVLLVAAAAIAAGFHTSLFWALCCVSWQLRGAAGFLKAARERELPLLQPPVGETVCGSGPVPWGERGKGASVNVTNTKELKYFWW